MSRPNAKDHRPPPTLDYGVAPPRPSAPPILGYLFGSIAALVAVISLVSAIAWTHSYFSPRYRFERHDNLIRAILSLSICLVCAFAAWRWIGAWLREKRKQ